MADMTQNLRALVETQEEVIAKLRAEGRVLTEALELVLHARLNLVGIASIAQWSVLQSEAKESLTQSPLIAAEAERVRKLERVVEAARQVDTKWPPLLEALAALEGDE